MWWLAAAQIAAPYIEKAFAGSPPSANNVAPVDPGLVAYQNQVMKNSMSPNSDAYMKAADVATNQVNGNMARLGLARSSAATSANRNTQVDLANAWQQHAMQNQMQALENAQRTQGMTNGINQFNSQAQQQAAMNAYNQNLQNNKNIFGGMTSAADTLAYNQGKTAPMPNYGLPMDQSIFANNQPPPVYSQPPTNYGLGMDYSSMPQASGY